MTLKNIRALESAFTTSARAEELNIEERGDYLRYSPSLSGHYSETRLTDALPDRGEISLDD